MAEPKKQKTEQGVPAQMYYNIFQGHPDGMKILEELSKNFYDRIAPAEPNTALFMEGQRSVVLFIIRQCSEGQK